MQQRYIKSLLVRLSIKFQSASLPKEGMQLDNAIKQGVISRVRPVVMTALMAMIGLMPAAVSNGIGSETQKPLAVVVIGGLITSTMLTLLILPVIYALVYKFMHLRENRKLLKRTGLVSSN